MNTDNETQLPKALVNLLERQIEFARRGNIAKVQKLAVECEPLAAMIAKAGLLDRPEYDGMKKKLNELYIQLQLMLSTKKEEVSEQINMTNKHKRTLAVYRGSV